MRKARRSLLEGRISGRDEEHAVQMKLIRCFAPYDEMGAVDRVEGSSEDRDSHRMRARNSFSRSISMPILSQIDLYRRSELSGAVPQIHDVLFRCNQNFRSRCTEPVA